MTGNGYVGPAWPDGAPEPEACCHFRCANDECPNHSTDTPCTRKYRVPGGYVCDRCAAADYSMKVRTPMRCSTLRGTEPKCTGTATHMLIYTELDTQAVVRDPVCKPCGDGFVSRPRLKGRIVPLHIHNPVPEFVDIIEGHRLVEDPVLGTSCHDCLRPGTVTEFKFSMLHGCVARPESLDHLALTGDATMRDANGRAEESARLWFKEAAYDLGMTIEDWRPVLNHPVTCATFTFRDREYRVKYDRGGYRIFAEKLENRGRPAPARINPEHFDNYKQVVFHFYGLINKYESTCFATYTPGREDVILYHPEGLIRAVLRITGLNFPESTHLAQVTEAVCDAFGAVADLTFQTRIYE
ncbi:hypothetical protein [Streptomyces sp. NPDC086776]|uniref:hypothetical protein n=1 Tax=Streptomyces sp. NPDC086776 TaxID=3365756 RepID=UPI0037F7427F